MLLEDTLPKELAHVDKQMPRPCAAGVSWFDRARSGDPEVITLNRPLVSFVFCVKALKMMWWLLFCILSMKLLISVANQASLLVTHWLVHADLGHHGPLMGDPRNAWLSGTFERVPESAGKDASADQSAAVCCQTDWLAFISCYACPIERTETCERIASA